MSQKKNKQKENQNEKKPLIDPKYKGWFYSGLFIAIVLVFFVMNNLNGEPEQGPYPPNYSSKTSNEYVAAPDFSLTTTNGKTLRLSEYSGKVVILDFWATWCPPCRKGIPDLIELKSEFGNDLEIIGISVDTDTKSDVIPFMQKMKINYPIVYGEMSVYNQYGGIRNIPTSFVLNKKGEIIAKYVGLIPKSTYVKNIQSALDEL